MITCSDNSFLVFLNQFFVRSNFSPFEGRLHNACRDALQMGEMINSKTFCAKKHMSLLMTVIIFQRL